MDFSKYLPSSLFEESTPAAKQSLPEQSRKVAVPPVTQASTVVTVATPYVLAPQPSADVSQNDTYTTLRQAVNFDMTEVGAALHKYLDPLASLANINEGTKFMMAWAQVQSIEHVSKERFLATFDGLLQALGQQSDSFNGFIQNQTDTIVTPKEQRIAELNNKITDLQQQMQAAAAEMNQVANDKAEAEGKIARAVSQFNSALSLRTNEINSDKVKYQNLLG